MVRPLIYIPFFDRKGAPFIHLPLANGTPFTYCVARNFYLLVICCVLRELTFVIRADWFFLLGINFCDFQKVPSTQH